MSVTAVASGIERAEVEGVVRRMMDAPRLRVGDVGMEALSVINGFGPYRGLFRFRGLATIDGESRPWSVVLKVVRRLPGGSDDPGDPRYWRREADAYASDLLRELRGLRPARCFGSVTRDPDTFTLWLEDLSDEYHGSWPLQRYHLAAQHLGEMSGTYCARPDERAPAWLMRARVAGGAAADSRLRKLVFDAATWSHADVRVLVPQSMAEQTRAQWEHADALQAALVRLPHTLCHNDAHAQNLFSMRSQDGAQETVALDWELAGLAPIASDITYLVIATMRRFAVDPTEAETLADAVLEGYLSGLRRAGWSGEPRDVHLAFNLGLALRVGLVPQILALLTNPERRAREERVWGRPADELVACWLEVARFVLRRVSLARELVAGR